MDAPVRILVAKPGLDGHDRGAKVVAIALARAGCEVVYTGLHKTIEEIVETALQEGVDAIGLSILSGAHLALTQKLLAALQTAGIEEVAVLVGGNIPPGDRQKLLDLGVDAVFPTGADLEEVARYVKELPRRKVPRP